MNIKFCNSISTKTKNLPTMSDLVKAAQTKAAMGKTASTLTTLKTAADNSKKGKDKDEADSSGQPEAEGKLVNNPKMPDSKGNPKGTKKASADDDKGDKRKTNSDEAESSGQLDVEPLHQEGESTGRDKKDDKKTDTADAAKSDKSAKSANQFVRVANLTAKQKAKVRETWEIYYPKSFIDSLLADR